MYHFDLRTSLIPFSMLRITNTFRHMKKGEEIEIVSGTSEIDKQTLTGIKRILARDSYELDENPIREKNESFIVTRLKKTSINHKKGDSSCQQSN